MPKNHEMHSAAADALDFLLAGAETGVIVPQSIAEFWNVCTRPADHNGLSLTPSEAETEIVKLEALFPVLPESPAIPRVEKTRRHSFHIWSASIRCTIGSFHESP